MRKRFVKRGGLLLAFALGAATVATGCIGGNCNDDVDCEDGFVCLDYSCQPKTSSCQEGRLACTEASQCDSNRCDDGCCVAQCASRLECAAGEECEAGVCRKPTDTGCKKNDDCRGALAFCKAGACVGCLDHADCSADGSRICSPQNQCAMAPGRCVNNGDCGENEQCVGNRCEQLPGCSTNAQCVGTPMTPVCRKADRECVQCLVKSDCSPDNECKGNVCEPIYCQTNANCSGDKPACDPDSKLCVQCVGDADCALGEVCENKACAPNELVDPEIGFRCSFDSDCIDQATNDLYRLRCVKDNPEDDEGVCKASCDYYPDYMLYEGCVKDVEDGKYPNFEACLKKKNPVRCPGGMACARVAWDAAAKPLGACMPASKSDAFLGEACSNEVSCRTGLECVPTGATTGACRKPCDPTAAATGCSGGREFCRQMVDFDGQNRPRTYGLCYGSSTTKNRYLDTCATSAGCDDWQVCSVGLNREAPTEIVNTCKRPVGETKNFNGCNADADCETGFCVGFNVKDESGFAGHCQQACDSDSQCGAGAVGACTRVPVEARNAAGVLEVGSVNTCVPQCDERTDCSAADGAVCALQSNGTGAPWTTRCVPLVGTLKGGGHCTEHDQCESGTCLLFGSSPSGICLGFCSKAADCDAGYAGEFPNHYLISDCPEAGVRPYRAAAGGVGIAPAGFPEGPALAAAPICWGRECHRDAECRTTPERGLRACVPLNDPSSPTKKPVLRCAPAVGTVSAGGVCLNNSECASGQCIDWADKKGDPSQPKRCYGPCVYGEGDCVAGSACEFWRWPDASQAPHGLCAPN